jgi:hypothetical protein
MMDAASVIPLYASRDSELHIMMTLSQLGRVM